MGRALAGARAGPGVTAAAARPAGRIRPSLGAHASQTPD